jgi:hypothetical protein
MMSLLPKEHGAYGQLTFPLLTSFAVAGVSVPSVLIACAVVAAFLAHEPLLVLLGGRGPRAKREDGRRARVWLAAAIVVAVGAGLATLAVMASGIRTWLLLPLVPAALVAAAVTSKREKSALGEIAVALTFSLLACRSAWHPARRLAGTASSATPLTGRDQGCRLVSSVDVIRSLH